MSNVIKCIVFSGGGIKGLSYIGCLKYLEEINIYPQLDCLVGTSAGGMVALLYNLGYKYQELSDILCSIDFKTLHDITTDGIFNYFKL